MRPALFHSAHHVIINMAVGTPLCWRLTRTRCHRVLPSQVSYGLIGWEGVGIKYSKPFACICKHTATCIRIWRGCPAEVGYLTVSVSWPSALHCNSCPTHCSPGNVPTPTPATLMDIPSIKTGHDHGQQIYMLSYSWLFESYKYESMLTFYYFRSVYKWRASRQRPGWGQG